jgi:hypothetical protein
VNVGLSDLIQAEATAINQVGGGEVTIRESLSDDEFDELRTSGSLIGLTESRKDPFD